MKSMLDADEPLQHDPGSFALLSRQYLENAQKFLQSGRSQKASELFWGAVAAAVHAVAMTRGKTFKTHNGLRDYIHGIAKESAREDIWRDFKAVEALHTNFYEPNEDEASVAELGRIAGMLVETLLSLLQDSLSK
jgi:uncharacterized protein (UPF0332 family)